MNTEYFKEKLLQRQKELKDDMARMETEARDAKDPDLSEPMERAVNQEDQDNLLQRNDADHNQLREVEEALRRIDEGTYGICVKCGRPIDPKRLEAVPWASLCLDDQEELDREHGTTGSGLTL